MTQINYKMGILTKIDGFELWCWRRLLRVSWASRRSNHSILKEINPGYSLEGLMLKLKFQYFGHLMQRTDSLEMTDAGSDWGQEEKGTTEDEMVGCHHWLIGHELEQTPGDSEGQGSLVCCSPVQRVRHNLATKEQQHYLLQYKYTKYLGEKSVRTLRIKKT